MQEYLKQILLFALAAALINQILPDDQYRRYGSILTGFLLILLFLQPILAAGGIQKSVRRVLSQAEIPGEFQEKMSSVQESAQEDLVLAILRANYKEADIKTCSVEATQRNETWSIRISGSAYLFQKKEEIISMLSQYYSIPENQIKIYD